MANDKDPLKQLKDLTRLKNQLKDIQRQVESEVSSGFPQALVPQTVQLRLVSVILILEVVFSLLGLSTQSLHLQHQDLPLSAQHQQLSLRAFHLKPEAHKKT
ncbi:uncharacterized protein KZ484_009480 isoform 2-T2 [Pholidichthys leucotaenia]